MIQVEKNKHLLFITLARPESKNALTGQMMDDITAGFSNVSDDIRAVLIKGAGDFFCAGGDLEWMKSSVTKSQAENEADALRLARMIRSIDECPVPVITEVKGGAFGGGVGLVAASDIVVADEKAVFSLSEVKLGLIPATIGPVVMRKIGISHARQFYLTGKRFSAQVAKEIHLVHEVVPSTSVHAVALDYVRELESAGPSAVRTAKALIRQMSGGSLWSPDISEVTSKILAEVRVKPEAQEGIQAFFDRRKASWNHSLLS